MAGSQTLRFDIIGDGSSATRAFRDTATSAALAARGAKQLSDTLAIQSKTAQVSASATVSLAKSDDILAAAQAALSGATDEASGSLGAMKLKLDELNGKVAAARVSLEGDKEAQARLDAISSRLTDLDHKTSTPDLDIQGVAKATAELSAVDVALDKVGGSGGSAAGASSSLGLLASPMGALAGAGVALSPVLVTAAVGLGGFGAAAVGAARPILAAAQAAGGLQGNLQTLNPQQQQAARGLLALENQYSSFSKALAPEVFSVFNSGLGIASTLLHDAEPVAAAAGKGLGSVIDAVNTDLNSAQWQQFFGFMAATAAPDTQLLGAAVGAVADDLPVLLENLQPVGVAVLNVAVAGAKAFAVLDQSVGKIEDDFAHLGDSADSVGLKLKIPAGNRSILSLTEQWLGVGKAADAAVTAQQQAAAEQKAAVTAASDLSGNLAVLEARYGLTASQAQSLVTAAGQTDKALQGSGSSATSALAAIEGYANASLNAQTPTQQLAGDIAVLDNDTLGATAQLNAFTDAFNLLVGNSVSDQQAVLATSQAFQALVAEVKNSGSQSLTSQSDFLAYVSSIGQGLSTLEKNGASVSQVNAYYQVNIDRLNSLHNLTPAQRADIQGLTKDYNVWANSTAGLNSQTATAAGTIKNAFTANLKSLGDLTPGISGDVNNLAASVLKTGTTSASTAGDRAKLIADLRQSGLSAADSRAFVDNLQTSINDLRGKTVDVGVHGSGSGTITVGTQGLSSNLVDSILLRGLAGGGQVPGSGNRDSYVAALTPGEVVVPKGMVAAGAVDHLRGKLPGFAAGGLVGLVPGTAQAVGGESAAVLRAQAGAIVQSQLNAIKKSQAAALAAQLAAGSPVPYNSVAGVTQWEPDVARVLGMLGLPQADLPTVMSQILTESGGNPNAINLTDINAQNGDPSKGLLQVISETFAAYRNPSLSANIFDPEANLYAGVNYAVHRYGNPGWLSVLGHGHGYANGTSSARAGLAVVGERGPELVNFRGGEQVIPGQFIPGGRGGGAVEVHLHNEGVIGSPQELQRWLLESTRALARTRGGGDVQRAFGRS